MANTRLREFTPKVHRLDGAESPALNFSLRATSAVARGARLRVLLAPLTQWRLGDGGCAASCIRGTTGAQPCAPGTSVGCSQQPLPGLGDRPHLLELELPASLPGGGVQPLSVALPAASLPEAGLCMCVEYSGCPLSTPSMQTYGCSALFRGTPPHSGPLLEGWDVPRGCPRTRGKKPAIRTAAVLEPAEWEGR